LSHKNAGFKTPIRALKGFKRINLKAGENKTIAFSLTPKELSIVDENGKSIMTEGKIEVSVGGCQPSIASLSKGNVVQKEVLIVKK
jgi:beta-glucosidase